MKTAVEQIKSETKNREKKNKSILQLVSSYQKSTIDTSKYDYFVTFYALFVDIGYEISTRTCSSWSEVQVQRYELPEYLRMLNLHSGLQHVLMNSINFGEKLKSLTSSVRGFQVLGSNILKLFPPNVVVFALLTTKSFFLSYFPVQSNSFLIEKS